jgi:hypothetical protein
MRIVLQWEGLGATYFMNFYAAQLDSFVGNYLLVVGSGVSELLLG